MKTLKAFCLLLLACSAGSGLAQQSLVDLASQDRAEEALLLIRSGADADQLASDNSTALLYAAHHGQIQLATALLEAGSDPDHRNDYGAFALSEAAMAGQTEIIRLLLENDADPELKNPEGESALMITARTGNLEATRLLLEAGADINASETWGGQTALMWASAQQHPEVIELLLKSGADPDLASIERRWARRITSEPRPKDMNKGGFTALHYAARQGCTACIEKLMDAGANPDVTDPDRVTPLNLALLNFHFESAAALIEAGADVNKWDLFGRSPLYNAIDLHVVPTGGRPDIPSEDTLDGYDIAALLLEYGANPNLQLKMQPPLRNAVFDRGSDKILTAGATPLLAAARIGHVDSVKLLLEHGAYPDLPNKHGQTPLMAVAGVDWTTSPTRGQFKTESDSIAILQLLLDAGADLNAISGAPTLRPGGNDIPRQERDRKMHNANQGAEVVEGQNALHGAARIGWLEIAQYLIDEGIRQQLPDAAGRTPLDYARGNYPPAYNDAAPQPIPAMIELLTRACAEDDNCSLPESRL